MSARRGLLPTVVCAIVILLAASASTAAAKGHGYPPARIWYRIAVAFRGEWDPVHPIAAWDDDFRDGRGKQRWAVHSTGAVRLSLRCVDLGDPAAGPFAIKRRVSGRLRTVGGCPRNAPGRFAPTVRFAASAAGEVTNWAVDLNHRYPSANPDGSYCDPYKERLRQLSPQGLRAQVSTPSSKSSGLRVTLQLADPAGRYSYDRGSFDCHHPPSGRTVHHRAEHAEAFGPWTLYGNAYEGINADGRWFALWTTIRFGLRAEAFGKADYVIQRRVTQPFTSILPLPGTPTPDYEARKSYSFTIALSACPDRGRDVEHC